MGGVGGDIDNGAVALVAENGNPLAEKMEGTAGIDIHAGFPIFRAQPVAVAKLQHTRDIDQNIEGFAFRLETVADRADFRRIGNIEPDQPKGRIRLASLTIQPDDGCAFGQKMLRHTAADACAAP